MCVRSNLHNPDVIYTAFSIAGLEWNSFLLKIWFIWQSLSLSSNGLERFATCSRSFSISRINDYAGIGVSVGSTCTILFPASTTFVSQVPNSVLNRHLFCVLRVFWTNVSLHNTKPFVYSTFWTGNRGCIRIVDYLITTLDRTGLCCNSEVSLDASWALNSVLMLPLLRWSNVRYLMFPPLSSSWLFRPMPWFLSAFY